MFVGHEFLAFALAAWGAVRVGVGDRAALHAGAVAAVAALLPDLDVAYALATYIVAVAGGTPLGWEAFWGVANATHRVVTHTLPTGVVAALWLGAAVAVTRWRTPGPGRGSPGRAATVALVGAVIVGAAILLVGFGVAVSLSAAVVAGGFLACVAAAGWGLATRVGLSTRGVAAAAAVGFLSHPFGDVFLAAPPPFLSPFGPAVYPGRVSLAADPTLDLLSILGVELAAVWAGVAAFTGVAGRRIGHSDRVRDVFDRRAAVGVAYAPAAVVLPRPTIADAHLLGATVVPFAAIVGIWAGYASFRRAAGGRGSRWFGPVYTGVVTGVTTLTLAAVGYAAVYLLV